MRETSLLRLLFGFDGRIGRQVWWIVTILLGILEMAISFLVNPATFSLEPAPVSTPEAAFALAFVIPNTAIAVKRFNDLGWPGVTGYLVGCLYIFANLAFYYELFGAYDAEPTGAESTAMGVMIVLLLGVIIVCGCLRGTRGTNRFGPDPIAGNQAPMMPNSE